MVPKVVLEDSNGIQTPLDTIISSPVAMNNSKENGSTLFSNGLLNFSGGRKFHGNESSGGENFELEDRVPLLVEEDEEKGEDGDESPLENSFIATEESAWVIALQVCFPYLIAGEGEDNL